MRLFFFIVFIVNGCQAYSQDIVIPFKKNKWNAQEKNLIRFTTPFNKINDTCINIKTDTLCSSIVYNVRLQRAAKPITQFYFGLNRKNKLSFFINNRIAGDLFEIPFFVNVSNAELYDRMPIVSINNFEKLSGGVTEFKPSISNSKEKPFAEHGEYSTSKKVYVEIMPVYYYSAKINSNNIEYEIAIIPHPFAFPSLGIEGSVFDNQVTNVNVYLKNSEGKFTMLSFGVLGDYVSANGNTIQLGSDAYTISSISLKDLIVTLSRRKLLEKGNDSSINRFKDSYILNAKTGEKSEINMKGGGRFLLLHFTGSWCLPCQTTLPELKKINEKYINNLHVISIQKENNLKIAMEYVKSKNLTWDCYYESLICLELDCLQKKFEVSAYPTFILLNEKGELIYEATGDEGLSKIEKILSKVFNSK
ncbi:MAG: TlpA family protein disulfide reductase [Hydrotalea flava]|nr:TlpA family protein disulfide reductase [Hydrotalea flava]